jgi:2-keto-4-pentenoate hydratase/2-oxohepta-3-ene-1,7-dioic acid hydratase in catechol pathway
MEAELAVIIGRACRNASVEDALSYVIGYTAANDVGCRRWQGKKGGGQWAFSKSFDTFAPLGPSLLLADGAWGQGEENGLHGAGAIDPQSLAISSWHNRVAMQSSSTADMVFTVAELVSFLSQDTTLLPGTVILTGTPEGVGYTREPPVWLNPGDVAEVEIEGVGKLCNPVEDAP